MFERRYSLAKFSVNLETKTIEIAETFSEALNSVAGVAIPVDVRERYADAVQGYTRGTISVVSTMSATEALSSAVKMSANIVARFTAAERLAAEVEAIKNLRAALASADSLAAAVQGSEAYPDNTRGLRGPKRQRERLEKYLHRLCGGGYSHGDHGRHLSDGGGRAYASHHSARGRAPA